MRFNFRLYFRLAYLAWFKAGGTAAELTPRRILFLVAFHTIFPLVVLTIWSGWLLDDVFFRGYRSQPVREPIFIVGNPRSGTTFFHRLMAKDTQTFTHFKLWEALVAPSITHRKLIRALAAIDRRLGSPLQKLVAAWESRSIGQVDPHKMALRQPDEDAGVLFYLWSSVFLIAVFPFVEELSPYIYFDTQLPPTERKRVMAFYQAFLQRHLHDHQSGEKRLLSKNPVFSPMVASLRETFPDAKFICLVRSPLETVPSLANYLARYVQDPFDPKNEFPLFDLVRTMTKHWYRYPLEYLEQLPPDSYVVVRYDDLIRDPEQTIIDIYDHFGFDVSPEFAHVLRQEAEKARGFRSTHEYSLEQFGVEREKIVEEYADVFERFGFDR